MLRTYGMKSDDTDCCVIFLLLICHISYGGGLETLGFYNKALEVFNSIELSKPFNKCVGFCRFLISPSIYFHEQKLTAIPNFFHVCRWLGSCQSSP